MNQYQTVANPKCCVSFGMCQTRSNGGVKVQVRDQMGVFPLLKTAQWVKSNEWRWVDGAENQTSGTFPWEFLKWGLAVLVAMFPTHVYSKWGYIPLQTIDLSEEMCQHVRSWPQTIYAICNLSRPKSDQLCRWLFVAVTLPCQDLSQHHKYYFPCINCLVPVLQWSLVGRQVTSRMQMKTTKFCPYRSQCQNIEDEQSCQWLLSSQVGSVAHSTNAESTDLEVSC